MIWEELIECQRMLDSALAQLRKSGTSLAQAKQDYKIRLREEVLKLKDEGKAITLIPLIVYGDRKVAELRLKRDIAESVYKANLEAINVKKLELKILSMQYEKEYENTERNI